MRVIQDKEEAIWELLKFVQSEVVYARIASGWSIEGIWEDNSRKDRKKPLGLFPELATLHVVDSIRNISAREPEAVCDVVCDNVDVELIMNL